MTKLSTSLTQLPANKATASAVKSLAKLGVNTVEDLLFYLPFRYIDFSKFSTISEARAGEVVTIKGKIKTITGRFSFKTRKTLAEAVISDATGSIKVTWFNQGYLAKTLKVGQEIFFSGKVEQYRGLQLINPVHEVAGAENIHTGRIVPIYHVTEGLYHRTLRNLVNTCLDAADSLEDILPKAVKIENGLIPLGQAIKQIHFPENETSLEKAKMRIIFEEILIQQLAIEQHRQKLSQLSAPKIEQDIPLIKKFLASLPFELTTSQKKALWEIILDLDKPRPMNRLLEGDTGSGKTLVALASALETVKAGFQVILLAPTEILAKQHFDTLINRAVNFKASTKLGLLTNHFHLQSKEDTTKPEMLKNIKTGKINIIIGTHALLEGEVKFKNLGLVIIDEQHRFGVTQRALLIKNSRDKEGFAPHLLSMSATPIPRTLALAFYGDLSISTLTQMPKGRQNILTRIINENARKETYSFITKEVKAGRQIFIVTPRVEESETSTIKSAKAEIKRLQTEVFPTLRLDLIHGKLKGAEKEKIMNAFNNREIDILVATSVIEIGIDVPNASVMLIEDAEKFGLAQLHQLRGRVGRGTAQSYCFLFTQSQNPETLQRLENFGRIQDGFKLAEMDLKQRGFGSLFGTEQTGFNYKFSELINSRVLSKARDAAKKLLTQDPELIKEPRLKTKVLPLLEQIHLE